MTVSIPAQPTSTTVCVKGTRSDITVNPAFLTFPAGQTTLQTTVMTGLFPGSFGVGATTGTGCAINNPIFSYVQVKLNVAAFGSFILGQSRSVSVGLVTAPAGGLLEPVTVTLTLSGDGAQGTTLSQSVVTLPAGTFVPQQVQIVTGTNQGDLVITATPSGAGAIYVAGPASQTVPAAGNVSFVGANPGFVAAGGAAATFRIGLSGGHTVTQPFTVTPIASGIAGTFSPASITFQPGDTTHTFTLAVGPATIGNLTLSFTSDSPYALTLTKFIVRVRGTMAVSGQPASLAPGQTSGPITLTLSHPNPTLFTLQIFPSIPGVPGSVWTPSSLTFGVGETSKSFTVTAGPGTGTLGMTFSATNQSDFFYATPGFLAIPVTTAVPTPAGLNVTVTPVTPPGGLVPVTVTFSEVTAAGTTALLSVASPLAPPSGYEVPGTPLYFVIGSSATVTGTVTACAGYGNALTGDPSELRLFRWVSPGPWLNVTESLNTSTQQICGTGQAGMNAPGTVQWAIFRPNTPPEVGAITGPTGAVAAHTTLQFSATVFDVDDDDELTATWVWGDGTTSPATITNNGANGIASGEHAFASGGTKTVTLVVTDGANHVVSAPFDVIVDAAPPVITALTATPGFVWPPDNKMHTITLTVDASDDGGTPVCTITGVTEASGSKQAAFAMTGALTFDIKAHPHTAYTATVTCRDAVDRTTTKAVTVTIEHVK